MINPNLTHIQNAKALIQIIKDGSYFGIFALSIIISIFIPVPEAIFLLLVGFAAKISGMNIAGVILIACAGIIIGDNLLYRLSFFGNSYVEKLNAKVRKHKLIKYEHLVTDNVAFSVYFLKFIAGVRIFGPIILGSLRASWKKFFIHNAIANFLHTTLLILLGYYLYSKILAVTAGVEIVKNVLLISSTVIVSFIIGFVSRKDEKKKS